MAQQHLTNKMIKTSIINICQHIQMMSKVILVINCKIVVKHFLIIQKVMIIQHIITLNSQINMEMYKLKK